MGTELPVVEHSCDLVPQKKNLTYHE